MDYFLLKRKLLSISFLFRRKEISFCRYSMLRPCPFNHGVALKGSDLTDNLCLEGNTMRSSLRDDHRFFKGNTDCTDATDLFFH